MNVGSWTIAEYSLATDNSAQNERLTRYAYREAVPVEELAQELVDLNLGRQCGKDLHLFNGFDLVEE